jgi:hypothetical protein
MMKMITGGLFCGIVLFLGCHPIYLPDRNLREYVKDTDVVGQWTLTADSLKLLARDGFKMEDTHRYQIAFLGDGTCEFQSVLDSDRGGSYLSARGTWKLEHDTHGDSNEFKKNALRIELKLPTIMHIRHLNFDRKDDKLILWSYYGDPDSWEFMEYTKTPNTH